MYKCVKYNKPRPSAGLFLFDENFNVCLIMRKFPYDDPMLSVKFIEKNNLIVINTFKTFLEMIQIPRGAYEPDDTSMLTTAIREFREETKCKNQNISMYKNYVDLSWSDNGVQWDYRIYIGRITTDFEFDKSVHDFRQCIINVSINNNKYRCMIDVNSMKKHHEILVIMNINEYYKFMINEQLMNYAGYARRYKDCLDRIMTLSYRKPTGEVVH